MKPENEKLIQIYKNQKADFLDNLQPNDFRNGGSFNQAEIIIDELNKALHKAVLKEENAEEFITKALAHLFRTNSPAIPKAISLSRSYIEMRKAQK